MFPATTPPRGTGCSLPRKSRNRVLDRLGQELVRVMAESDVRAKFETDGFRPVGSTPEEFARFVPAEIGKWAKTIKAAGIRAQ
ncbi:MAG: hypothetical protein GEV05_18605 [Betaproteobacteria bacterium]|nr:hypothetical protein [Betaproteobacteria bacterium]